MSKTVAEIKSWLLSSDVTRVILVEVESSYYLSTKPYVGLVDTTYINYMPCIKGGISYTESLSIDGTPSISYGDIELDNTTGLLDSYLNNLYQWKNRVINIYIGDASWARSDFSLIYNGLTAGIMCKDRNTLGITLVDKLARLNTAVTEETIGYDGSTPQYITSALWPGYDGSSFTPLLDSCITATKPVLVGECFNITPIEIAASNTWYPDYNGQVYMCHDSYIGSVIEVRDNAAPVEFATSNNFIVLKNASYGLITASVQGYVGTKAAVGYTGSFGSYSDTIAGCIKILLTGYGSSNYRLTDAELDFPNPDTTPYTGYYCAGRENVLDVCNQIAASGGYQLVSNTVDATYTGSVSSAGKVKLIKMQISGTPDYTVSEENFILNSLTISEVFEAKSSIKLGYCKNWTVHTTTNLAEALVPESIPYFKTEYLYLRNRDLGIYADYRDQTEPPAENVLLNDATHAAAELTRRKGINDYDHYVVTATYLPDMLYVQLGQHITFDLINPNTRFYSIINNETGIVYKIQRNWIEGTVTIGVLI